jgi:CheY-like chemotaxis protein
MSILSPGPGPEPSGLPVLSVPNTVLIAEDDPMFRRVLETWLQKWNYRVTSLENGLDAWSVLQQKDAPQMAILDWMMPGLDGVELCRRIPIPVTISVGLAEQYQAPDILKPHELVRSADSALYTAKARARIFLRRLAHDEPSGSTQAAAKCNCGCSLAASDERAKVKSQRNSDVTSATAEFPVCRPTGNFSIRG